MNNIPKSPWLLRYVHTLAASPIKLPGSGLILILLILILGRCSFAGSSTPEGRAISTPGITVTSAAASSARITPTPFQPLLPTPSTQPAASPLLQSVEKPPPSQPRRDFYGIDFSNTSNRIRINIYPRDRRVNYSQPVIISFIPGERCNYGDQHACISVYKPDPESEIIFITTHSGIGGKGEAFRYAVEGIGINRAGFSLQRVRANLSALEGAKVTIAQGKNETGGFVLVAAGRVPATSVGQYFSMPIENALKTAAAVDPALRGFTNPGQLQLVFETCGWKMSQEPWAAGVTSTTGSVYFGVIQKKPQP